MKGGAVLDFDTSAASICGEDSFDRFLFESGPACEGYAESLTDEFEFSFFQKSPEHLPLVVTPTRVVFVAFEWKNAKFLATLAYEPAVKPASLHDAREYAVIRHLVGGEDDSLPCFEDVAGFFGSRPILPLGNKLVNGIKKTALNFTLQPRLFFRLSRQQCFFSLVASFRFLLGFASPGIP